VSRAGAELCTTIMRCREVVHGWGSDRSDRGEGVYLDEDDKGRCVLPFLYMHLPFPRYASNEKNQFG
jgi:hypothetical protein